MTNKKIFLIGYMGVGKTFLGEQLAENMNLPFYDIDREIEIEAELDVNQIFLNEGEAFFRKLESNILTNWCQSGIISTGAGIIEKEENRKFLQDPENLVVWLDISWEIVKSRIVNSYRPLVLNRSCKELEQLFNKRYTLYQQYADVIYNGSSVDELKQLIVTAF